MRGKKEDKFIFAVRDKNNLHRNTSLEGMIGSATNNFILVLGEEKTTPRMTGVMIEQELNRNRRETCCFQRIQALEIAVEDIFFSFPITYEEVDNRIHMSEEDLRRFTSHIKAIADSDESNDESVSGMSGSQQHMSSFDHRVRGRPARQKRESREDYGRSSSEEYSHELNGSFMEKRKRGRPKGAKNIRRIDFDDFNQFNLFESFCILMENKSIEEVNTKNKRIREREEKNLVALSVKKEESSFEEYQKRTRGRPKGVKNKPKRDCDSSSSSQSLQKYSLPKRKTTRNVKIDKSDHCCQRCTDRENKKAFLNGKNIDVATLNGTVLNIGVEDTTNIIITAIKQGELSLAKRIILERRFIETDFVTCWDTNFRLQDCGYTVRTREMNISKRRREGINALIHDSLKSDPIWWKALGIERILTAIPNTKIGIEFLEEFTKHDEGLCKEIKLHLPILVRNGSDLLAYHLLEKILNEEDNASLYGYSKEHLECLNRKRNEIQFRKITMLKQNATADFCSPIHCAVINQNTELLPIILKNLSDFNVGDSLNRKPVHYACILESSKVLDILVKAGGDLKEFDKRKTTPLMLAAKTGRVKNIRYILENVRDGEYINFKNDEGLAAVHFAAINKHTDCLKVLLEDCLLKAAVTTKEGMTIQHIAVANGDHETLQLLGDKYNFPEADNFRRTLLMYALRNHQTEIFFTLFQQQTKYYKRDYSYNTLLHYAAAYGNIEVLKYLLEVKMPQLMNRRSFYPFEIAVLKGHLGCALLLENWNLHLSQHLLCRILKKPRGTKEFINLVEYLLHTKKYDLDYKNPIVQDNTCLHLVCAQSEKEYFDIRRTEKRDVENNEYAVMQKTLLELLLEYKADPKIKNDRGETPVALCIYNDNLVGIRLLLQEIPFDLHYGHFIVYLTNLACLGTSEIRFVYEKISHTEGRTLKVELQRAEYQGFNFLVYLVKSFTENVHSLFKSYYLKEKEKLSELYENNTKKAILLAFETYLEYESWLIKLVVLLIEKGCDPKFVVYAPRIENETENYRKWGCQHFLMRFPSPNLLKVFMKWIDTKFNLENSEGRTPLHLFCLWNNEGNIFNNNPNVLLPTINYPEMNSFTGTVCLNYLLEKGLTSNVLDINRSTPLLYAAMSGQLKFISLLRAFGSTINHVNLLNQIPLIELIKMKDKFSLQQMEAIFEEEGAIPDFKDTNDRNVLHHLAATANYLDASAKIFCLLLKKGVKINSLDQWGRSPVFYCFISIEDESNQITYREDNKIELLRAFLLEPELNLNILDKYSRTLLHYACQGNFYFSIMLLLEHNINSCIMDEEKNTPLAICLLNGNLKQASLLIKKGVTYGEVFSSEGVFSYFKYAMNLNAVPLCFLLLDYGYPLKTVLEETEHETFKRIIEKRNKKTLLPLM